MFPENLLPDGPDRPFVQDLVYTVIRNLRALRTVLGLLIQTQWPKGELEALLYVGAAQILFMPDVPDFAAVNETVEAAKECRNPAVARVVNGILRNLIRRRDDVRHALATASFDVRESFPRLIARRWATRFGEEKAAALCAWHNRPAETYLARRDGSFVVLEHGRKVCEVAGYADGEFIVQDPATHLAIELLDPQPGEEILDACAAPGGKTVQIAWRGAKVTACEVNPKRRQRLEENLRRIRIDARIIDSLDGLQSEGFAKILVDAPCSNSGVFRRRPDARWNWSVRKLGDLTRLQAEILEKAAMLCSPGGRLVYSTCSNEPEENALQVEAFLKTHPDFKLIDSRESIPFESGHDGAFAACLVRNGVHP